MWSIRWLTTRRLNALRVSRISTGCQEPFRLASPRPWDQGSGRTRSVGEPEPRRAGVLEPDPELPGVDHGLPDGLQPQRPEFARRLVAVEGDQGLLGVLVVVQFLRGRTVGEPVEALGVLPEPEAEFGDGQVGGRAEWLRRGVPPRGEPFVDDPLVFPLALLGAVVAEEEVPIFPPAQGQGDDSLSGLFVEAIARKLALSASAHAADPHCNSEDFRITQALGAALPTAGRERISLSALYFRTNGRCRT